MKTQHSHCICQPSHLASITALIKESREGFELPPGEETLDFKKALFYDHNSITRICFY